MIATIAALPTFTGMLARAGFETTHPDPRVAWSVFKEFSAIPVSAATDGLLFQCGTYAFNGEPRFECDFTRQFTRDEDGESQSGMEQLSCTIFFPPTDQLSALRTNTWSFGFSSFTAFFAAVEALPEFRAVMNSTAQALDVDVRQEEV